MIVPSPAPRAWPLTERARDLVDLPHGDAGTCGRGLGGRDLGRHARRHAGHGRLNQSDNGALLVGFDHLTVLAVELERAARAAG